MADNSATKLPKALMFDVFGTCVDWRSTVTNTLHKAAQTAVLDSSKDIPNAVRTVVNSLDASAWGTFAQGWRDTYLAFTRELAMNPNQDAEFKTVDQHWLDSLKDLTAAHGMSGLWTPAELQSLSLVWHRLDPWRDSVAGVTTLNESFATATLTNGNTALIKDLAAYSGIPFTHIFGADVFKSYKPDPKVYRGAAERLGLQPAECGLVAAHLYDLKAAKDAGYGFAVYVARPEEEAWDEEGIERARTDGWVDIWVEEAEEGFVTAAERLRAWK